MGFLSNVVDRVVDVAGTVGDVFTGDASLLDVGESLIDAGGGLLSDGLDAIGSSVLGALDTWLGTALYYVVVKGLLGIVDAFYQLFAVFAGMQKVQYNDGGSPDYLINIFFFRESGISGLYWAMALIGIALLFGFMIVAVIRKAFDMDDKHRQSIGSLLRGGFKSFLIMLLMSFFIATVINVTNVLMTQINLAFDHAYDFEQEDEIEFTDQQYATMARVLNTVGNASMNPSFQNRYNINSCFNEIRPDLYELQQQGVFSFYYKEEDENGEKIYNWQNVLQRIANSADLSHDLKLDVLYDGVYDAMNYVVQVLDKYPGIMPLNRYEREYQSSANGVSLDRVIFLVGTHSAALSEQENENGNFTDGIRGAFYSGEKSIYSYDDVTENFNIKVSGMSYVLMAVLGILTLRSLWHCIVRCVVRIFTMLGLYIVAPPFAATIPLDEGEKFKQWTTALVIQAFGVFGAVIPMRLLLMFIPMALSDRLVLFPDSTFLNLIGKAMLLVGALEAVDRFGGIITGILANNVGMEAINAGNTDAKADSWLRHPISTFKSALGFEQGSGKGGQKQRGQDGNQNNNDDSNSNDKKKDEKLPDKNDSMAEGKDSGTSGGSTDGKDGKDGGNLPGKNGGMSEGKDSGAPSGITDMKNNVQTKQSVSNASAPPGGGKGGNLKPGEMDCGPGSKSGPGSRPGSANGLPGNNSNIGKPGGSNGMPGNNGNIGKSGGGGGGGGGGGSLPSKPSVSGAKGAITKNLKLPPPKLPKPK